jgi:hypothetical protein
MYCWKNWFAISGEAPAKLLTKSNATINQYACFHNEASSELTAKTQIGDISHSVLDSPQDGIIDKLELCRR